MFYGSHIMYDGVLLHYTVKTNQLTVHIRILSAEESYDVVVYAKYFT